MTSGRESERKHAATSCNRRNVATSKLNMHVIHFDLGLAVVDFTIFFSVESRLNDSTIDRSVLRMSCRTSSVRCDARSNAGSNFGQWLCPFWANVVPGLSWVQPQRGIASSPTGQIGPSVLRIPERLGVSVTH